MTNDPDQRAYLRVGIDLGLDRDPKESGGTTLPTAVVRDTILNVLMATKLQDVTTVEGKRKLKEQILVALQQRGVIQISEDGRISIPRG